MADAENSSWQVIHVKPRVDSFNQDALINDIKELRAKGAQKIALDMKSNRFLSLPVIRYCTDLAKEIAQAGGSFALISCPQKTKRHFEIYGSVDNIKIVRFESDLGIGADRRAEPTL